MFTKGIGYLSNHSVGKAGTILPKMYLSNTLSISELRRYPRIVIDFTSC